jgi:hypothetical protein
MDHDSIYAVANPETGWKAYPAMTAEGYPVRANGSVEGCDCDRCEDRRDLDMAIDGSQPTQDANYCLGTETCPNCESLVEVWESQDGLYSIRIIPGSNGEEHSC